MSDIYMSFFYQLYVIYYLYTYYITIGTKNQRQISYIGSINLISLIQ